MRAEVEEPSSPSEDEDFNRQSEEEAARIITLPVLKLF
jgi:hypothetical protein